MRVCLETSFFSYLTGRQTPLAHIALRQAATLAWWEGGRTKCELFISDPIMEDVYANRRAISAA